MKSGHLENDRCILDCPLEVDLRLADYAEAICFGGVTSGDGILSIVDLNIIFVHV